MKAFLFSVSVLTLMIVAILCNSCYVKSITHEMKQTLESMQCCALPATEALQKRWQKAEKKLELSISAADIGEISTRLSELCVAARFENKEAFEQARALCLNGIARIQDLERFSFLHIL